MTTRSESSPDAGASCAECGKDITHDIHDKSVYSYAHAYVPKKLTESDEGRKGLAANESYFCGRSYCTGDHIDAGRYCHGNPAALPEGAEPPTHEQIRTRRNKLMAEFTEDGGEYSLTEFLTLKIYEAQRSPLPSAAPTTTYVCAGENTYPCVECGTMRTTAQGGRIFSVCDSCWDKKYPKSERSILPSAAEPLYQKISDDIAYARKHNKGDNWLVTQIIERRLNIDPHDEGWYCDDCENPIGVVSGGPSCFYCGSKKVRYIESALPSPGAQPPSDAEQWLKDHGYKCLGQPLHYEHNGHVGYKYPHEVLTQFLAERTSAVAPPDADYSCGADSCDDPACITHGRSAVAPVNEWQRAIEDACACLHLSIDPDDPRKSLQTLIAWEVKIALDPKVSEAAQDLINRGAAVAPGTSDLPKYWIIEWQFASGGDWYLVKLPFTSRESAEKYRRRSGFNYRITELYALPSK